MNGSRVVVAAAPVASSLPAPPLAAQFTAKVPAGLTEACELPRAPLTARTIAANPEIYPQHAARVAGGWLIYAAFADVRISRRLAVSRSAMISKQTGGNEPRGSLFALSVGRAGPPASSARSGSTSARAGSCAGP